MALISDTGPLYAAMDRSDVDHVVCVQAFEISNEPILVPAPVVVEVEWLSHRRLGATPFLNFLTDISEGRVEVVELIADDYTRARELMTRYGDLPLGFVDSTVVAIAERLGETKVLTLDHRHFTVVRPRHIPAFRLLP